MQLSGKALALFLLYKSPAPGDLLLASGVGGGTCTHVAFTHKYTQIHTQQSLKFLFEKINLFVYFVLECV